MSENQKQMLVDITNIISTVNFDEAKAIAQYAEKIIDLKLLSLVPDAILENMDTKEKLMLIREFSKTEQQRQKEEEEAIPFEEILKEEGLDVNDLHD